MFDLPEAKTSHQLLQEIPSHGHASLGISLSATCRALSINPVIALQPDHIRVIERGDLFTAIRS